ncbi:MAG: hypothetical protein JOZ87_23500 [Chloroflexi bacterium]|nr:hypothetical protein [Chloroflexota bacterium]
MATDCGRDHPLRRDNLLFNASGNAVCATCQREGLSLRARLGRQLLQVAYHARRCPRCHADPGQPCRDAELLARRLSKRQALLVVWQGALQA